MWEREIKFIGLFENRGHRGPYKPFNHNLYIGRIIIPHIDNVREDKALHGKAPAYISQLLSLYTPTRPLRSENKNLLRVPRCRLEGFGRRCFAYAAPSLWNPPPTPVKCASSIDTFKSSLKTYLFNVAYPSIHWLLYCMSMLFVTLFKCFLFKSAFEHGDFSPFLKLALYKCNIIIIIITHNLTDNHAPVSYFDPGGDLLPAWSQVTAWTIVGSLHFFAKCLQKCHLYFGHFVSASML